MQEFRCKQCGKLLFKGDALGHYNGYGTYTALDGSIKKQESDHKIIQIKCNRQGCKTVNEIIL